MKRPLLFPAILCVLLGFLCGSLLPAPWDEQLRSPASAVANGVLGATGSAQAPLVDGSASNRASAAFSPQDNPPLLVAAGTVAQALKVQDYAALAAIVHPQRGVTFTPYSTVNFETDLAFTPDQIKNLSQDQTVYTWGTVSGRGTLIELTIPQYFSQYVFNVDYTQAPQIGVDRIITSGNALENLAEAYPGCRFVDLCFPGLDVSALGQDWCSLKLVFEPGDAGWLLVGVVHGQWTI